MNIEEIKKMPVEKFYDNKEVVEFLKTKITKDELKVYLLYLIDTFDFKYKNEMKIYFQNFIEELKEIKSDNKMNIDDKNKPDYLKTYSG